MGKRGPHPKKPDELKSRPVSIRLTPALWERLEKERKQVEPERSLSHEIELRLQGSLEPSRGFHDDRTYFLARMIDEGIVDYIEPATQKKCWEDPYTFGQVKNLIDEFLKFLRPKGRRTVPKRFRIPQDEDFHLPWEDFPSLGAWAARAILPLYQLGALGMGMPLKYQKAGPNIAAQLARAGYGKKSTVTVVHRVPKK